MRTYLGLFVVLVFGCSGPRSVTPTEFCQEWGAIQCTTHHCCSMPGITAVDCPANPAQMIDARCHLVFGDLHNPNVRWDGVAAAAALDRMRTQAQACTPPTSMDVPDAFITGTGQVGDDCTSGLGAITRFAACAAGTCDPNAGRCVTLGGQGAACLADDQRCTADLYCPMPADVCVPRTPIGGPCDSQHPAFCITRRCAADAGVPPADGSVDSGLPVNGTCQPPIPDGDPCGEFDTCNGRCLGGTCTTLSPSDQYFCAPPPPIPGYFG
jgi:hypothetical protein